MKEFAKACQVCVGLLLARSGKQRVSGKRVASGGDIFAETKVGKT